MSTLPETDEMLIAEIYGWKWDDTYDFHTEVKPAINDYLQTREDISEFCDTMRSWYWDTDTGYGPISWRDFRYMTVQDAFDQRFDRERVFYEIEGAIRSADV